MESGLEWNEYGYSYALRDILKIGILLLQNGE